MEKLIDVRQLSEILGVKTSTIYGWIHEDSIPYYKINRLVRFNLIEIMEWLRQKKFKKQKKKVPLKRHNS